MKDRERCIESINKLYTTRLSCGKNLLELTTYNDIALWWMIHPMFINVMCSEAYFPMKRAKFLTNMYSIAGPLFQFTYDVFMALISKSILTFSNNQKNEGTNHVKFLTQNLKWKFENKVGIGKDIFFESIMLELKERGYHTSSFYPVAVSPIIGLKILIQKLKRWNVIHKPTEAYYNIDVFLEYFHSFLYFKKKWKTLCDDDIFKEICKQFGSEKETTINDNLQLYFVFLFPFLIRESKLFSNMIIRDKPSALVMINEYGWLERSYLVAAKKENVPVLAIQHGIIHPSHSGYIYGKGDISNNYKSPFCPIPDLTAVSGDYYRYILIKQSSYPEHSVIITGQPVHDELFDCSKKYNKVRFLNNNKINPNHKIVLWTTQFHGFSDVENMSNLECIFKTLKEIDHITLIIKPHPGEPDKYSKLVNNYILKYMNNNVILVPRNSDIYELIFNCDILITKTSTTAIEAAALKKPVIVLNLSGSKDDVGYVNDGIAIGAYSAEDLKIAIHKLIDNSSMLSAAQDVYIKEHLSIVDGKSSKRVVDVIVEAIS